MKVSFTSLLLASGVLVAAQNKCNADNCLRALRATATPGRLAAAQSMCATLTVSPTPPSPTISPFAASACASDVNKVISACSCLPTPTMTTSTSTSTTSTGCPSPTANPGELVKNAGFETKCLEPWDFAVNGAVKYAIRSPGYTSDAEVSLQADFSDTYTTFFNFQQFVPTVAGQQYGYSARFKYSIANQWCNFKLYFGDVEALYLDPNYAKTTQWQLAGVSSITAVSASTRIAIQVYCYGTQTVAVDDVTVTLVSRG